MPRGNVSVGTVRDTGKVTDLLGKHPATFTAEVLNVTDTTAVRQVVDDSFARLGRIDPRAQLPRHARSRERPGPR